MDTYRERAFCTSPVSFTVFARNTYDEFDERHAENIDIITVKRQLLLWFNYALNSV